VSDFDMKTGLYPTCYYWKPSTIRWWERWLLWFIPPITVNDGEVELVFKKWRGRLYVMSERRLS
jgi:hypothetical protein